MKKIKLLNVWVNRSKPTESISIILEMLEKKEDETNYMGCSITDLVEETGMDYPTVKEYINLILDVQHGQHVELVSTRKIRFCPEGMYMIIHPKGSPN